MQRFQLPVYPDEPKKWKLVDKKPDKAAFQEVYKSLEYADQLDPAEFGAEQNDEGVWTVHFTPEAQEIFNAWEYKHMNWLRNGDNGLPPYLIAHLGKGASTLAGLALDFHVADMKKGNVDEVSLNKAIGYYNGSKSNTFRIYDAAILVEEQTARLIAKKLLTNELPVEFTVRNLYKKGWVGIDKETAMPALEFLQETGWGQLKNISQGNKPSYAFETNTKIYKNKEVPQLPIDPIDQKKQTKNPIGSIGRWGTGGKTVVSEQTNLNKNKIGKNKRDGDISGEKPSQLDFKLPVVSQGIDAEIKKAVPDELSQQPSFDFIEQSADIQQKSVSTPIDGFGYVGEQSDKYFKIHTVDNFYADLNSFAMNNKAGISKGDMHYILSLFICKPPVNSLKRNILYRFFKWQEENS